MKIGLEVGSSSKNDYREKLRVKNIFDTVKDVPTIVLKILFLQHSYVDQRRLIQPYIRQAELKTRSSRAVFPFSRKLARTRRSGSLKRVGFQHFSKKLKTPSRKTDVLKNILPLFNFSRFSRVKKV